MKKVIIAAAIITVTGLASLTVSSKTTNVKPIEKIKVEKADLSNDGFGAAKNNIASID